MGSVFISAAILQNNLARPRRAREVYTAVLHNLLKTIIIHEDNQHQVEYEQQVTNGWKQCIMFIQENVAYLHNEVQCSVQSLEVECVAVNAL